MQNRFFHFFILLLLLSHFSYSQSFYKEIVPRYHNVFVGVGPAFMYADNAGGLRNSSFKTRPAASLGYSYKANSFIEVKGTFGYQMLESQDPSYYSDSVLRGWVAANQAIGFKGNAYYLDIMPLFHLPFERHIDRGNVNIYAGVGLGVMFVDKEEAIVVNNEPMTRDRSMSLFYLPLRGGISYRIGDHGDLALEATVMASFSDDIDGNVGFNRYNDHLFQAQIIYKRYLSPFPFWNK